MLLSYYIFLYLKSKIYSEGSFVKVTVDEPTDIVISTIDGKIIVKNKNTQMMNCALNNGAYLISINGKTTKYIHIKR